MYKPSTKAAWVGRTDSQDGTSGLRWHQVIRFLNLTDAFPPVATGEVAFALLGFCCDEGVSRNLGRPGAAEGPAALRKAMAPFAHHLPDHVQLYDAGDVICTNNNLGEAQEQLGRKIALLLKHGYRPLVLGGGHEIAYGHYLGLEQAASGKSLGILNFDAHFDLRSYAQQPSSGTPFLQIADRSKAHGDDFRYEVIGLQEYGNTRILFQTADRLRVKYTFAEEVQLHNLPDLTNRLNQFLATVDKVYLTIDLDVFVAGYAPGVSAVNALGLQPEVVLALLKAVAQSGKLLSIDVAELNPSFDIDNRTAKLGAGILYQIITNWSKV
ncbi:formiminoglutamase [Pontibacter aydingkolensis]|uniref:Formimidoylglutamase n=1 Tax=Pontibacter aydingkolensis TaxID=1911536 RepID=A0ABS7CZI8_9BACT|nr:formimidoylglutamase [Pontibacter aydingkolensis]MBW7469252.1 formimidoylglutamase [Pontibacter aydingkolensis]